MPALHSFDYAVIRIVPRVEREEFLNAGLILFCRTLRFLDCRIELDRRRLAALNPHCDPDAVQAQLDLVAKICAGGQVAGPLGQLSQAERFHWLTSPRSTVIQVSLIHSGLCAEPRAALEDLFARLVAVTAP